MTNNPVTPDKGATNTPVVRHGIFGNRLAVALSIVLVIVLILTLAKIDWSLPKSDSSTKTVPASTQYPVCLGAENTSITFENGEKQKVVRPQEHCWSAWVKAPPGSAWMLTPVKGKRADIVFWDGSGPFGVRMDSVSWLGDVHRAIFRIRGSSDSVIVTISSGKS